ncbi:putative pantoate-beta-alanine ligase protein [Phaeoacremonium minimum UCRPA7]|uniref:Pantoate--beta-alanine ligase n=1 Tax=Phaeoacremonium minimum (strain UCR-PA7) TaxID=1286976 RepID=R8BE40_PHAM7|nr:putative pantoate-beta-alanine ligase protein [Phaeoacremonium minimum UCRPA7]EON97573.1 putative pantoate-beta-alanine ligase protein [Phaeoacremonium minimum UCRPA7]
MLPRAIRPASRLPAQAVAVSARTLTSSTSAGPQMAPSMSLVTSSAYCTRFNKPPLTQDHPGRAQIHTGQSRDSGAKPVEFVPESNIRVFRSVDNWRAFQDEDRGRSFALVPTMGALHEGHISLIRAAARDNEHVVVSIYVNPAQFGIKEDLSSYPVTWDQDCKLLVELNTKLRQEGYVGQVSAIFAPTTPEMYPSGFPGQEIDSKGSFVTITPVGEVLEGASRPTFFRGVATVCMKLFNIIRPSHVYFGQKDVQQTVIIRRMVQDFRMPIDVVIGPTVRESDGLALSSRNVYLGERRRKVATVLSRALRAAEGKYLQGELSREEILGAANKVAADMLEVQKRLAPEERVLYEVDYISLASPETMAELDSVDPNTGGILSGAIKMLPVEAPRQGENLGHSGGPAVRLIDNIILKPQVPQTEEQPSAAQEIPKEAQDPLERIGLQVATEGKA